MADIFTTKGYMDESLLEKRTGVDDNANEHVEWIEYWLNGELVHRSVHMTLKKFTLTGEAIAASLG
jgi:hypothetical protein